PKAGPQAPASPGYIEGGLLALQAEVGNRAIAGMMAQRVVQRHPEATSNAEMGEPELQPGTATETAPPTSSSTEPGGGGGGTGTTGTTSGALTGAARTKARNDALNASN